MQTQWKYGLDPRGMTKAEYTAALREHAQRAREENLEAFFWLLKGGLKLFWIYTVAMLFLNMLAMMHNEGRNDCVKDGIRLCAFKAEYAEKHYRFWAPWKSEYPWHKPGWQVPADWQPKG